MRFWHSIESIKIEISLLLNQSSQIRLENKMNILLVIELPYSEHYVWSFQLLVEKNAAYNLSVRIKFFNFKIVL